MKKIVLTLCSLTLFAPASWAANADAYTDWVVNPGGTNYAAADGGKWYPYIYGFGAGAPNSTMIGVGSVYSFLGNAANYPQVRQGSGVLELALVQTNGTAAGDFAAMMIYENGLLARSVQIQATFTLAGGADHALSWIESSIDGNLAGFPFVGQLDTIPGNGIPDLTTISYNFATDLSPGEQIFFRTSSVNTNGGYDSFNNGTLTQYVAFNGAVVPEPSTWALMGVALLVVVVVRRRRVAESQG